MYPQYIIYFISKTKKKMEKFLEYKIVEKGLKGIIPSHGNILTVLFEAQSPMTMKEIAQKIGKNKSTVSVLIQQLIDKGYIEKSIDPQDRRNTQIKLTSLGQSIESKYKLISDEVIQVAYQDFTEEEIETFLKLLKKMNQNFVKESLKKV